MLLALRFEHPGTGNRGFLYSLSNHLQVSCTNNMKRSNLFFNVSERFKKLNHNRNSRGKRLFFNKIMINKRDSPTRFCEVFLFGILKNQLDSQ
jgi:hypothetical protein